MATVDEILTRQAYAAGDETWTKDNNYPSYTMYAEPEYVPVTNKRIADFNDQVSVRGEQNAQFVGFQLPRYDDAMDLSTQNLYIHYQTVYGGSDGVPCNVSWSDNYVRLCWMIPGQATQEPGSIQMMIYATGVNSVGDRIIWKTLPATYTIHDGLEIGGGIPEPDQSWYEQFVAQMEDKVSTAQGYANDAQASKTAAAGSATAAAQSADASAQALAENKDYVESQKETFVGYNKRETDLKYANALIGSASGTGRVTVGDAWEAPIPDLEVAGKSDQFTTTGAQLFDASKIPVLTAGGATVVGTADGGYRISGSGDLTSSFYETVKITDISMLKPGNIMLKSEATVPKLSIKLINSSSATLLELSENQTKTITEDMLNTEGVYLQYMLYGPSSRTITPGTYYPMLYQDGDGTWEPYTGGQPSPSPDYPQPIISTGTVTTGAQLFDAGKVLNKSVGGATIVNNADGSITISGTGTMTATLDTRCTLTHEETMTLIGSERVFTAAANIATYPHFYFEFYDKNGAVMRLLLLNVTSVTKSLPAEADMDTLYIQTGYYGRADESIVSGTQKVMVNAGSTALPWEPYTGGKPSPSEEYPQPLEVTVTGDQLFDASAIKSTSSSGISFVNNNDGSITVKGTSLDSADTYGVKVDLQPGVYYTSGSQGNVKIMVRVKDDGETKYYSNHDFVVSIDSYVDIYIHVDAGKTVDTTIWPMLNAGSTALPWQPYQSCTATIPLTEPLRGIGDVRDRIMYRDGEWGVERQFIALTFDGSENWEYHGTAASDQFRLALSNYMGVIKNEENADKPIKIMCDRLKAGSSSNTYGRIDCISSNTSGRIYIYLDDFSSGDVAAFKTYLSTHPIRAIFERATPTWTPLPAATQSALNALTTFTGTTHITITAGGPEPDVAVEYVQDTKAVIADLQAQINAIRNGGTT